MSSSLESLNDDNFLTKLQEIEDLFVKKEDDMRRLTQEKAEVTRQVEELTLQVEGLTRRVKELEQDKEQSIKTVNRVWSRVWGI